MRTIPDSLSDNSKLVLVRRLIREGLLRVVGANEGEETKSQLLNPALNQELILSTQ